MGLAALALQGFGLLPQAGAWVATHFVPLLPPLPCPSSCGDPLACAVRLAFAVVDAVLGHPCPP